ncbi:MAG TPA: pilus assembly PilX N-terminal domain-containing protein [Bacteroidales bacterium]|nr:pilus assembly PilX N-terminal domain-containing protein [Bacteroidales bacterium]
MIEEGHEENSVKLVKRSMVSWKNEKGMVLVVALLVMAVLIILGTTAVMTTTTDLKISGNYKQSEKAFYVAEAGIEEARSRMRDNFTPSTSRVIDSHPTQTGWFAFIGTESKSQGKGYNSSNSLHVRMPSLQSALDYTVKITHQTDSSGNILYWGDVNSDGISERNATTGENIYLVTSYGVSSSATKTIEPEITAPVTFLLPPPV